MGWVSRRAVIGVAAVVAVAATGVIGYRVLAPAQILDPATVSYPQDVAVARPKVYGTLLAAPILVDNRLRVYAGKRQVYADRPVDIKSSMSPFWSYRRWPAEVVGVVATGTRVVTQWDDGDLVALDAERGTVAWHAHLDAVAGLAFTGRRTGAQMVYDPPHIYTAGSTVIATGAATVAGYDAATGRQLWQAPLPPCRSQFTGPDVFVCIGATALDARTGQPVNWSRANLRTDAQPVGCALGHSGCRGLRAIGTGWVIGVDGGLTPAPALARPNSWLVDDVVVDDSTATSLDGHPLWTVPSGHVIAVEPGAVHLLTADREVVTLDPVDGRELSRYPLAVEASGPFDIGQVYAADRFLFIERLRPGATPDLPDSAYFYPSPNVVVAGS
jgi:hypothetical protein